MRKIKRRVFAAEIGVALWIAAVADFWAASAARRLKKIAGAA